MISFAAQQRLLKSRVHTPGFFARQLAESLDRNSSKKRLK